MMQFAGKPGPPYEEFYTDLAQWAIDVHEGRNPAGRFAATPETVAATILHAATDARPRARYAVGPLAHGALAMRRMLPDPLFDRFVQRVFPTPRAEPATSRTRKTAAATETDRA